MISRRTFIRTTALGLAGSSLGLAGPEERRRARWEMIANDDPIVEPRFKPQPNLWSDTTITATWIGHATVLLNILGTRVITDPVLSERIGLNFADLFTIGPRRLVQPALAFEELPPVDLILISHAHLDHLDIPTLKRFGKSTPIILAKNTFDVVQDLDYETVYELDWGEWTAVGDLRVEALEARHFGWRFPWEKDRSRGFRDGRSYNAYLLSKNGINIVFGGDTAYHQGFSALRRSVQKIDLALMPIGAYDPWIRNHASPEEALAMTDQMGAYHILPIHWATFIQSEEPTPEPMERLKRATVNRPDRIVMESVGQTWALDSSPPEALSTPGEESTTHPARNR
jgi:L-ascorbate metabolism protein UlaG (beta-lactamase superfamily)